mmetsp:Transcript_6168/g.27775  ORF Transcript_6168/g.27775 Transcript_6168/m.27775 type:complete len:318 (+) Transcript_6168:830-1783(+)
MTCRQSLHYEPCESSPYTRNSSEPASLNSEHSLHVSLGAVPQRFFMAPSSSKTTTSCVVWRIAAGLGSTSPARTSPRVNAMSSAMTDFGSIDGTPRLHRLDSDPPSGDSSFDSEPASVTNVSISSPSSASVSPSRCGTQLCTSRACPVSVKNPGASVASHHHSPAGPAIASIHGDDDEVATMGSECLGPDVDAASVTGGAGTHTTPGAGPDVAPRVEPASLRASRRVMRRQRRASSGTGTISFCRSERTRRGLDASLPPVVSSCPRPSPSSSSSSSSSSRRRSSSNPSSSACSDVASASRRSWSNGRGGSSRSSSKT